MISSSLCDSDLRRRRRTQKAGRGRGRAGRGPRPMLPEVTGEVPVQGADHFGRPSARGAGHVKATNADDQVARSTSVASRLWFRQAVRSPGREVVQSLLACRTFGWRTATYRGVRVDGCRPSHSTPSAFWGWGLVVTVHLVMVSFLPVSGPATAQYPRIFISSCVV